MGFYRLILLQTAIFVIFFAVVIGKSNKNEIFPSVRNSINNKQNELCNNESLLYKENLKNFTLWAHKMLDSSAKSTFGVLGVNTFHFGDYTECLNVMGPFPTQYCLITLTIHAPIINLTKNTHHFANPYGSVFTKLQKPPHNLLQQRNSVKIALCLPASCRASDIRLNNFANSFKDQNVTYEVSSEETLCTSSSYSKEFGKWEINFCVLSVILVFIVLLGTAIDGNINDEQCSMPRKILLSVSAKRTLKELFRVEKNQNETKIFDGVRTISIMLIVLAHTGEFAPEGPWINGEAIEQLSSSKLIYLFEQMDLVVNTFFVVSALLLSYRLSQRLKEMSINPLMLVVLRYIRLTPVNAYIAFYFMTILNFTGSGPVWNLAAKFFIEGCQNNWFWNLLYLNNFMTNGDTICNVVTWFVACEFQLFIMGVGVIFVMKWKRRVGFTILAILFIASIVTPFVMTIVYNVTPVLGMERSSISYDTYLNIYYIKPYSHASCYIIGLYGGIIYHKMKSAGMVISEGLTRLILSISVFLLVISCGYLFFFYNGNENYFLETALYNSLHRPLWSVGVLAIFIVSSFGTATSIKQLLSLQVWGPLSKLTYGVFLIHLTVLTVHIAGTHTVIRPTFLNMISSCIALILISFIAAFFLYIFVESPFLKAFKTIFLPNYNLVNYGQQSHSSAIDTNGTNKKKIIKNNNINVS